MSRPPKRRRQGRLPEAVGGIQVNCCRNPNCANYGMPPAAVKKRGRPVLNQPRDPDKYKLTGGRSSNAAIICMICGETLSLKSNQAVAEELARMLGHFNPSLGPSCSRSGCTNNGKPVTSFPEGYYSYGKTRSGSVRYRCKPCGKTFSMAARSSQRQKRPEINAQVFKLLMNKAALRRICEIAEIHPVTLYTKIDFIARQCGRYAAQQERPLLEGKAIERLYIGVDRQDHLMNWGTQLDRRNVTLHAIASADNDTGYVFGMHLDYDPSVDIREAELDALETGDYLLDYPYRRYARIWLPGDQDDAYMRYVRSLRGGTVKGDKAPRHAHKTPPSDAIESAERPDKLPARGAKVRSEYTMMGHFYYLKRLLGGAGKLRFFLDQDSGIRAACLLAFQEEVRTRRADAFFVRINKVLTVDKKRLRLAHSKNAIEQARQQLKMSDADVLRQLMKDRLSKLDRKAKWNDRWVQHPAPDMGEPEKAVCHLTDYGDYDPDHLANLYLSASLRGIDRFFMQVRRRIMMLERPIATASKSYRIWHGYSAYDPAVAAKLMQIFRVYYNYCLKGEDKRTPAMRLGLAAQPTPLQTILNLT